jgi:squalene-hopene/tetraprenyl-beta-curcumene cyclase
MLDAFSCQARPANDVAIARGCAFLRSTQRGDGSWHSAAGARLIHGTAWAIRGLIAAGATIADPVVAAGVNWLLVHQHESGGWGEAGGSPCGPREFLAAEATVSQTAWAVLALVAAGLADHDATRRAIEYLVDQQLGDGAWVETQLTECDSAGGGWYRNDLHSSARPFLALSRWAVAIGKQNHDDKPAGLRLLGDDWSNEI